MSLRHYNEAVVDHHALKLQMRLLAHDAALRRVAPDCVTLVARAVEAHLRTVVHRCANMARAPEPPDGGPGWGGAG